MFMEYMSLANDIEEAIRCNYIRLRKSETKVD